MPQDSSIVFIQRKVCDGKSHILPKTFGQYATMKLEFLSSRRNMMARVILDAQIQEISAGITKLGSLVVTAIELALQALQSGDQTLCTRIIEADKTIDELRSEVERLTFRALTFQQPLA